jgi:hypothetical protein
MHKLCKLSAIVALLILVSSVSSHAQGYSLIPSTSVYGLTSVSQTDLSTGTFGATFGDTGASISLPSAGTYLICAEIMTQTVPGTGSEWFLTFELYNSTDSAVVANSQAALYSATTGVQRRQVNIKTIVTVTAAKTIKLYANNNPTGSGNFSTVQILSDANHGYSRFLYVRLQ